MYKEFENLIRKMGITAYQVSKDTGISQATLTNWKKGTYVPKMNKLQLIADYLGVSIEYLGGRNKNSGSAQNKIPVLKKNIKSFPVLSKCNYEKYINKPFPIKCDCIATVTGNSMSKEGLYNNDKVFIRIDSNIGSGELVAVCIDREILIRRLYYCDGKTLVLGAAGDGETPVVYSDCSLKTVTVIGKAVAVFSYLE